MKNTLKHAFVCGLGMAIDLSGSPRHVRGNESIATDFARVGDYLASALSGEGAKITSEVARLAEEKQLKLELTGA